MFTSRRFFLCLALGLSGVFASCANDTSIDATEVRSPSAESTRAPASTNDVSAEGVDTTVDDGVAADPTSAAVPVRSRGQRSASEQDQTYTSIRDVDFMNGFSYDSSFGDGSSVATVIDGAYENGEFGDTDYYWFGVTEVEFGDLDADGIEDAVVATSWNGGGSGFFDNVHAFRLVDGQVQPAGMVPFGDRADGGIAHVRIEDDVAYVWSFSTTAGACCPTEIRRNTLVLGDHWFVQSDNTPPRAWLSIDDTERELKFLPGTSSAVIAIYGWQNEGVFLFDAAKGQRLSMTLTDGPAPTSISMTSLVTGTVLPGLGDFVLPADGLYEVTVAFDAARAETTTLELIIGDGEPVAPISWSPVVEQQLITEEPYVTSSLVWPVFVSDQPGTAAANDALATLVLQLDDLWVEGVTEITPPLDDSAYDLRYDVTLATSEIAAVRFDYYEYVCCRPYPNYGPVSAVLDLRAGRIIPVDEILDMNRIDEITTLWITELERQGLTTETVDALLLDPPRLESLALLPEGVEFGTGRNGLGGGSIGALALVAYEELGTLVNPDLLARLATR